MEGPCTLASYAHGCGSLPLLGQTIGDNLRTTVERFPDREALVVCAQKQRLSYRQLWDETTRIARGLLAISVQPGDRVGIWASNRSEWVITQYATAHIGAILVNINPAYLANELEYVLRQAGVSILLYADGFRQNRYGPMLAAAQPRCPQLRDALHLDRDWDALCSRGESVPESTLADIESTLGFDDPINIQYTSGTTGSPKGATLTHHNLVNNGYTTGVMLGYTEADRVCIPVPFYHCFGMVLGNLACTTTGACMVAPGEWFQPAPTLAAIASERCTSLYGVPTMFRALLEDPDFARTDCSSLRTGIMAGAPCPVELMRLVVSRLHMPEVAIGYGMTETSPLSTMSAQDDSLEKRVSTVGRVLPHIEISIRDRDTGRIVPRGTAGEFCTRGYSVMCGYWQDDDATRASIDSAGWMHSGDLAVMEPDGYVHIVGRLKDMIIRGGENISPREIEEVLVQHHAVAEVQVIGVPSAKYGEEVMAWVRLAPGECVEEQALALFCRQQLASYKMPRYWRFTDTFPMTVTGKIQKFRLRQMAVEILGRQADAEEKTGVKGTVPLGRLVTAWLVLIGGLVGFWLMRPFYDTATWNNLQLLVLFTSSKCATLLCMPVAERRSLPWGRYFAYLVWPGMQPRFFLQTNSPEEASDPPTVRWTLVNLLVGVLLLWVVPALLPAETPLFLRVWIGLAGFGFLCLFALMDAWALLYRWWGIGVGKLWVCPIAATSLNEFWSRRWNRIFSGMLREVLFLPLARRIGARLALFAVFLYSGVLHENTSVAAESGYGGPMLYFLIQFAGVWLESPRWVQQFFQRWPAAGWLWTGLVMVVPLPLLLHQGFIDRVMVPSLVGLGVPGLPGEP